MPLAPGIADALVDIVGHANVFFPRREDTLRDPRAYAAVLGVTPDAVVSPCTAEEVAEIVRGAVASDITVRLPCATVLCDGTAGEILLTLARLTKIVRIDPCTPVAWGTNRHYPCRVHMANGRGHVALCGFPVDTVLGGRPEGPGICPDCALVYVDVSFPMPGEGGAAQPVEWFRRLGSR